MNDFVLYKFNAQGDTIWTKRYAPKSLVAIGNDIAVDDSGNTHVNVYSWGMDMLPTNGIEDAFVIKFDEDGNLVWAKSFEGTAHEFGNALELDGLGNIYITELFSSLVDFNTSTAPADTFFLAAPSNANRDVYILKITTNGDFVWVVKAGGTAADLGSGIAIDGVGDIFVTGSFNDSADFGSTTLVSAGETDAFLAKFNHSGNFLWAKKIGGIDSVDAIRDIKIDASDSMFLTRTFSETVDLNPDNAQFMVSSVKTSSLILKLSNSPLTSIHNASNNNRQISMYPNPVKNNNIYLTSSAEMKNVYLSIYIYLGEDGYEAAHK